MRKMLTFGETEFTSRPLLKTSYRILKLLLCSTFIGRHLFHSVGNASSSGLCNGAAKHSEAFCRHLGDFEARLSLVKQTIADVQIEQESEATIKYEDDDPPQEHHQRPQQPPAPAPNGEQWSSSSESVVTPFTQNSGSGENMMRATKVNNAVVRTAQTNRFVFELVHTNPHAPRYFSVGITPQTKSSRNLDYVVSRSKGETTLYTKADTMVPFVFTFADNLEARTQIRVRAEYSEDRYMNKAVERCPNHQVKDTSSTISKHFVRSEHPKAEYQEKNGMYSVRYPMCDSNGLCFTCFSSCSGGINRRPLKLLISLETPDETVIDAVHIALKVCANPLRDSSKEEEKAFDIPCNQVFNGFAPRKRFASSHPVDVSFKRQTSDPAEFNVDNNLFECHVYGTNMLRKIVWCASNLDRIEELLHRFPENNPLHNMSTEDTLIKNWLNRPEISLGNYAQEFEQRCIYTLGDLLKVNRGDIFSRLGFDNDQCLLLNKALQDFMVNRFAYNTTPALQRSVAITENAEVQEETYQT